MRPVIEYNDVEWFRIRACLSLVTAASLVASGLSQSQSCGVASPPAIPGFPDVKNANAQLDAFQAVHRTVFVEEYQTHRSLVVL
jgi:hypothetical protein